jgi:MFS family permease
MTLSMKTRLAQVGAMVRYELLMQWRRRLLLVAIVGFIGPTLLLNYSFAKAIKELPAFEELSSQDVVEAPAWLQAYGVEQITGDDAHAVQNTITAMATLMVGTMFVLLIGTIMFAEMIPRDRQMGMHQWLNGLPLGKATYLAGKTFSVWVSMTFSLALGAALIAITDWQWLSSFDIEAFLAVWAVAAVPVVLVATGMSIALTSTQPTRRRAAIMAALLTPIWVYLFAVSFTKVYAVVVLIDPLYWYLPAELMGNPGASTAEIARSVFGTLATMALWLALVMVAAWGWMRWRDGRS